MLLCVSTREAGPYPDYKHRTGRGNMFTSDWKNAKMFALPSLRSYQPCLPDEPLRLHQLRRPTRCTHRRSKRNWYNTEGLNQFGLQKLCGPQSSWWNMCAASQPWIWGQKKSEKRIEVFNFQHSGRPCRDLTFDCSPEHKKSVKGGRTTAHRRTIHTTTKKKGGFAALPPPHLCLWISQQPKLSITAAKCSSCFYPSPLWPSHAIGTIYGTVWHNHAQGYGKTWSK